VDYCYAGTDVATQAEMDGDL